MYVCGYKMVGTEVLNILVNEKCLMKWELEAKKKKRKPKCGKQWIIELYNINSRCVGCK